MHAELTCAGWPLLPHQCVKIMNEWFMIWIFSCQEAENPSQGAMQCSSTVITTYVFVVATSVTLR